ncbi:hypothetical protein Tco_1152924 [Tanacetum coccineum]
MANHSQKWHDGTTSRNIRSSSSNDGLASLLNKLDNLGRDMKTLKESVHAIQVGCQILEGPHLDKDFPLNEEVKQVEEVRYGEFRRTTPFNGNNGGKFLIMEYSVNISKRRTFWSLNEDILKINDSDNQYAVSIKDDTAMDDPNMTMEEYIKLEEEKARRRGRVFNWETATYWKIRVDDNLYNLRSVEAEFPAIVIDDAFAPEGALLCKSQVVDFQGMLELMRDGLFARLVIEHRDDAAVVVFTISVRWSQKMIELEAVYFDLRITYQGGDGVPSFARRFAAGRKSGAHICGGQFVVRLAEHFGLLTAEILGGLTVIVPELLIIDMTELVRLQNCIEVDDTWAWVAIGPERQPDAAAGTPKVAQDAPVIDEGGQADPTPSQAPPPPPAAARTMP